MTLGCVSPLCSKNLQLKTPSPGLFDEGFGMAISPKRGPFFPASLGLSQGTADSCIWGPNTMKRLPGHTEWHRVLHTEHGYKRGSGRQGKKNSFDRV